MSTEFSEYILMLILFCFGFLVGGALSFRHKEIPGLKVFVSNSILCGAFGIVGGGVSLFFFKNGGPIVLIGSGILAACIPGIFSNEEIKRFVSHVIFQKLRFHKRG